MLTAPPLEPGRPRSHLPTVVAVAVIAYALCDLVHEVVGHGIVAAAIPGVDIVSLTTVALQTSGESRVVAAAGSIANVVIGAASLGLFGRRDRFDAAALFLWLFGAVNLLNGCGYPLYSAILGFGDWEVVIRGMQPAAAWRIGLGIVGAVAYASATAIAAGTLARAVRANALALVEVPRLVLASYVAGGLLLVAGAAVNTIDPSLVYLSGVSSGFGAMAGLMLVPRLMEKRTAAAAGSGSSGAGFVAHDRRWITAGIVIGVLFTVVIGRGIRF